MSGGELDSARYSFALITMSVVGLTSIVVISLGCIWCRSKWRKLTQKQYRLSDPTHESSVPPVQNVTEFTIFPPPACSQYALPLGISADEVIFEPLPEIRSRVLETSAENIRPARFTGSFGKISLQDWFDEYQVNFPRNQLKYFREVGNTWYGQAVEGEAFNILLSEEKTKVVVKILRVDATATEHMQYLQETRPFRDLKHPNILHMLGRCLEVHPFLLIMEQCHMDLKTFLIEQRKSPENLLKHVLRMACNISAAVQHMHEHGFIHTDIAAHSCLITTDLVVKLGDYGTAVHVHRGDFYCLGDVAFPIRWCAPEALMCTESVIEAKEVTREANLWSFGVLLWELLEFGKLPYFSLNNDEVIQKVLIDCSLKLEQPKTPCVHKDMIYKIMQFCWLPSAQRPTIQKVAALLNYLYDNKDMVSESAAFESRWNSMQPVLREHNLQNTPANISFRFESDFSPKKELDSSRDCDSMISSSDFNPSLHGDKSPSSGSFSEAELAANISPSLLNLRGSVEDLIGNGTSNGNETTSACSAEQSGLETIQNENAESIDFSIDQAIKDLDTILADELSSSDTSKCNTPEKITPLMKESHLDPSKMNGFHPKEDSESSDFENSDSKSEPHSSPSTSKHVKKVKQESSVDSISVSIGIDNN